MIISPYGKMVIIKARQNCNVWFPVLDSLEGYENTLTYQLRNAKMNINVTKRLNE